MQPSPLALGTATTHVSCFGGNNGAIDLFVSGGVAPYSYSWSTGEITQNISDLTAGNYTVMVADSNGCGATIIAIVNEPTQLVVNGFVTDVSSAGGSDGAIDLFIAGGTAPYNYAWSTNDSTQNRADNPVKLVEKCYRKENAIFIEFFWNFCAAQQRIGFIC